MTMARVAVFEMMGLLEHTLDPVLSILVTVENKVTTTKETAQILGGKYALSDSLPILQSTHLNPPRITGPGPLPPRLATSCVARSLVFAKTSLEPDPLFA